MKPDSQPVPHRLDEATLPAAPMLLVSHALCPYVQRVAIVLAEKGLPFERRDIDLAHKPAWFLDISPQGKTPVLCVGAASIFESSVICEYLDDTTLPRLHPTEALRRARHRAWMEFASGLLNAIGAFYGAADERALQARAQDIRARLVRVEAELREPPWFDGPFSLVDAAFAPAFRYFDVFDGIGDFGVFDGLPKVSAWRSALRDRTSVQAAVQADYPARLRQFLQQRGGALGRRIDADAAATSPA